MSKNVKCPDYAALLGHFARISIERDYLKAQIEESKIGTSIEASELDRLLRMLGKALFRNKEKLTGNVTVANRNNLIWRRIVDLLRNSGERFDPNGLDEFSDLREINDKRIQEDDGGGSDWKRRDAQIARSLDAAIARPAREDQQAASREQSGEAGDGEAEADGAP